MSVPNCCVCCSFVIKFEIRKCDVSSLVLLSRGCFGYLGSNIVFLKMQNTELRWKAKEAINKMKRQLPDSEKIFANHILSDKGLNIKHT